MVARSIEFGTSEKGGNNTAVTLFTHGPVEESRELLRRWRPDFDRGVESSMWPILKRFDVDAVPALVHAARSAGPKQSDKLLLPVVDVESARLMADWLVRLKTGRRPAEAWLERYGADAALLLVPDAVGNPGSARAAAEGVLRHLAVTVPGLADLAEAQYGADAAEAVRAILAVDSAELLPPVTAPALPDWLADLPQKPEQQTILPADQTAVENFISSVSRVVREGAAA